MAAVLPVQYGIETDRDLEAKLAGKGLKGAAQLASRGKSPIENPWDCGLAHM